jgi:predicted ribosomally synthesized peptide with nif11-like leader
MSEDQFNAFQEAVKADAVLQEKLKAADAEAVVVIAQEAGFLISIEDLGAEASQDLSDQELESVAGGVDQMGQPVEPQGLIGNTGWLGCSQ